ncbi:hypothetical protein WA026_016293 [Henosepilachna vigintioctopunctata]|uniref:Polyprenal reductase n=1 Tax=Henosepilachna vigintioctopunctata TaxID=420089 RepID=A0AAW1ULM5_9CUCU
MYSALNLIEIYSYTSVVCIIVFVLLRFNPGWNIIIPNVTSYGKLRNTCGKFEMSKAYFKHFYRIAVVTSTTLLVLILCVYFLHVEPPKLILHILQKYFWNRNKSLMSVKDTIVGLTLYTIHCYKRFYETHFVNVFSKSAQITVIQYIAGIIYYPFSFIGVLSAAPKFAIGTNNDVEVEVIKIDYLDILVIMVFLCSAWVQYKSAIILSNLRRNSRHAENRDAYKIPEGGLFMFISSPHINTEILIYICLLYYFQNNLTWISIFLLVLANQMNSIYETHEWYKKTFRNYPSQRKMFIPLIY